MLLWVLGVLVVIVCLLWLGLQVQPRTFRPPPVQAGAIASVPLPEGLPRHWNGICARSTAKNSQLSRRA